jgi:transposase InsO family protein
VRIFGFIAAKKAEHSDHVDVPGPGRESVGVSCLAGAQAVRSSARGRALTVRIVEIHERFRGVYGSPRVHAELVLADGERLGRKRVERLMRGAGISGLVRRWRGRTTIRVPGVRVCEDLVDRAFAADGPDRLEVAHITYLRTGRAGSTWPPSKTLLAPDRGLVDGRAHAHRARPRRARDVA